MYETFGARVTGQRVEFRLFFPDRGVDPGQYQRGGTPRIAKLRVVGDFQSQLGGQDWEAASGLTMSKQPHAHGWLYTASVPRDLPEGYFQYKYFVTFENGTSRWCTDPCTKYGGADDNENSAFVIGGNTTTVVPMVGRLPPQDLIIYELMIDDFTSEWRGTRAPIDAIHDKIDYLLGLGINAVEFMPWTAWPGGDFSWGYNPLLFFSVEYRYVHDPAAPADKLFKLKTLINALHARGLHVIMDGVYNHVAGGINPNRGFPYLWLYQDPQESPFIGAFEGGGFFEEFDFSNRCTAQFIEDVCRYWLDVYQVDGIRFDYTRGFHRAADPGVGITRLVADLKTQLSSQGKQNVALILEHLTDNRFAAIHDTNQIGATNCWFDPFMYKSFDYVRSGTVDREALRILDASRDFDAGRGPVTYVENHDHSTLTSVAGGRHRWYKGQPAAIALFMAPGSVMVHNGQEFGEDYYLPEHGADRVQPRVLRWFTYGEDFVGQRLRWLYARLAAIRAAHPALRSANFFPRDNYEGVYGVFPEKGVVVFHRYGNDAAGQPERFMVAINYSDADHYVDVPFCHPGEWRDLLNGDVVRVDSSYRLIQHKIPSNWGRVYFSLAA